MITKVLNGHTSPETALVVNDHPCGYQTRCKIRFWLETSDRGVCKGRTRFVSQTTNPRFTSDIWCKPKVNTYGQGLVLMYLNEENHVLSVDLTHRLSFEWLESVLVAPGLTDEQKNQIAVAINGKRKIELDRLAR